MSRHFLPTSWIVLKQLFLSPSWPLSQYPIWPLASWAIDSEPIRAQGIIVKNVSGVSGRVEAEDIDFRATIDKQPTIMIWNNMEGM